MSTQLVDPYGDPVSSTSLAGLGAGGLYAATRPNPNRPGYSIPRVESFRRSVGTYGQKRLLSESRDKVTNFSILEAAIETRAYQAIGRAWTPLHTADAGNADVEKWAEKARKWLEEWFAICDVEGDNYDFRTGLFLNSTHLDTDGDFVTILTKTEDGYPQIQTLASDRIGTRANYGGVVGDKDARTVITDDDGSTREIRGAYRGLRIENGIIFNVSGSPVAVRILGGTPDEDQDISLRDCIFKFDPKYRRQSRGLPVYSGALDFIGMSFETYDAEARALMASSYISLLEWNDSGSAPNTTDFTQDADGKLLPAAGEEMYKGQVRYYRSGSGGKIEGFSSARPGDQWSDFQDRLLRIALSRVWPYALTWKADGNGGTQQRSDIEQARGFVRDRQDVLRPVARRIVGWAVSRAILIGILPQYPGEERVGQLAWDFEMPPLFSIDHGREDQQERESYKIGISTMRSILDKDGDSTPIKDHWRKRAEEEALKQIAIQEVEAKYAAQRVKIDPRNIQMLTPNDMAEPVDDEPVEVKKKETE